MRSGYVAFALIAIAVFLLDRLTKSLVAAQIPYGTEVPVIDHLVGIGNYHNSGAAFGVAPALAVFFLIASVVVAIGLIVYVVRSPSNMWNDAALGLILGGTLGNGYERIMFGTVTDFINFHFWPVFNVADSAISIGVVALVAGYLIRPKPAA